jgi:hypothetical protein
MHGTKTTPRRTMRSGFTAMHQAAIPNRIDAKQNFCLIFKVSVLFLQFLFGAQFPIKCIVYTLRMQQRAAHIHPRVLRDMHQRYHRQQTNKLNTCHHLITRHHTHTVTPTSPPSQSSPALNFHRR